jgi:hypothetical protein
MSRFSTKAGPQETAPARVSPPAESPPEVPQSGLGWTVALSAWVIGFIVLVVYELWNFIFPLVRGMFR